MNQQKINPKTILELDLYIKNEGDDKKKKSILVEKTIIELLQMIEVEAFLTEPLIYKYSTVDWLIKESIEEILKSLVEKYDFSLIFKDKDLLGSHSKIDEMLYDKIINSDYPTYEIINKVFNDGISNFPYYDFEDSYDFEDYEEDE